MKSRRSLIFSLVVAVFVCTASGKIIYVDDGATGANDGTSWANGYRYLQDALADANSSDKPVEIRVAQGIYRPDQGKDQTPGDREATFQLVNGVALKGGYAGFGESHPDARDITLYETILTGDLNANDVKVVDPCELRGEVSRAENSYHVVTGSGTSSDAILDGFTISGGNANETTYYREETGSPHCSVTAATPVIPPCAWLYADGGGMYNLQGSPTISNCTFMQNSAEFSGGGMCNCQSSGPALVNCTFTGNVAGDMGGALSCMEQSSPIITNATFKGNKAYSSGYHTGGGGIYCRDESSPVMTNCIIANNWAIEGGGMFNLSHSSPTLTACTFSDNGAREGGAMVNYGSSPTLRDCTFTRNSVDWSGGAIRNIESSPTLMRCVFRQNSALDQGGGVFSRSNCSPNLVECTFWRNCAHKGGGIHTEGDGNLVVTRSTFVDNCVTGDGGAVFNQGLDNVTLTNCAFIGNYAHFDGGGIRNVTCSPAICNCAFENNSAGDCGGGLSNFYNSSPTVADCRFTRNAARKWGGAIHNSDHCYPTISNCVLDGNFAAQQGGGIYSHESNPAISNCTFDGNRAGQSGGAIASWYCPGQSILTNCILWGNLPEETFLDSAPLVVSYSDVRNGWPGEGNIDVAPCFTDPGHWDPNGTPDDANDDFWVDGEYHLKSQAGRWDPARQAWIRDDMTSPCIDAGDPASPIGQEPFPNGGRINMGAYGGTGEASKSYFGEPVCETVVVGDINGDCKVDFADFAIMALHWLEDNSF